MLLPLLMQLLASQYVSVPVESLFLNATRWCSSRLPSV